MNYSTVNTQNEDGIFAMLGGGGGDVKIYKSQSVKVRRCVGFLLITEDRRFPWEEPDYNFVHSYCLAGQQLGFYILFQKFKIEKKVVFCWVKHQYFCQVKYEHSTL